MSNVDKSILACSLAHDIELAADLACRFDAQGEISECSSTVPHIFGCGANVFDDLPELTQEIQSAIEYLKGGFPIYPVELSLNLEEGVRHYSGRIVKSLAGGYLLFASDTTAQRLKFQEMQHRASHDALTQLLNRGAFEWQLRDRLEKRDCFCFMLLDLDDFKSVNDSHGHDVGDEMLRVTARRITDYCQPLGLGGRLGGDEFGVIVQDVADTHNAKKLAYSLLQRLSERVTLANGITLYPMASLGIAIPDSADTFERIYRKADQAVYAAKASPASSVKVYDATKFGAIDEASLPER